jgi:hypothetical protein
MTAMRAITTPTSARGDKTYNSDLLQKRSHVFTEEKPFTPRTLKTKNRSSKLSEYKYYTPPPQKRSTKKPEEEPRVQQTNKQIAPTPKPRPRHSDKSPQRVDASNTTHRGSQCPTLSSDLGFRCLFLQPIHVIFV